MNSCSTMLGRRGGRGAVGRAGPGSEQLPHVVEQERLQRGSRQGGTVVGTAAAPCQAGELQERAGWGQSSCHEMLR